MSAPLDDVPGRAGEVPGLVARLLPDLVGAPVRFLGAGWDNACYLLDERVVLRLCTLDDGPAAVAADAAVLGLVGRTVRCAVPRPVAVDAAAAVLAYELVPGVPLTPAAGEAFAAALGADLARLHAVPLDEALAVVERMDRHPATRLEDAERGYAACHDELPPAVRRVVERFLAAPPPRPGTREALCHNDLAAEHVLLSPVDGSLAGVIDWSDARVTDPMADLAGLYRDAGPAAADVLLRAYRTAGGTVTDGDVDRVRFAARCAVVLDLEHAITSGRRRHLDEALRVLPHTFA